MNVCSSSSTILVFARAPVPGHVKTRLAARLGAAGAAEAHRACTLDAVALVSSLPGCARRLLFAGEASAWQQPGLAPGAGWEIEPQHGRDLGERLENAFADAFRRGAKKVVVIGTDTPWMGAARLRTALAWLDGEDVVLGPSFDGGYYLVGARRMVPEIFRGIAWGTSNVLYATRLALERAFASYRMLGWDFDLDRPADLGRARALLRDRPLRAPRLDAFLRSAIGQAERSMTTASEERTQT
ncbi:MAG: TIGR04282 family arsenosugar biosynthesis glycosyltransferase [Acidobacteriota bacterium]|nr:TIGR04282 family arsenosugar biosynthesis glycosyltransferase [Acidobacteriota bacterium]